MLATVKFVLRVQGDKPEFPIAVRITYLRKHTFLFTKHKISPKYWDEKSGKVKSNHPLYKAITEDLSIMYGKIVRYLNDGHPPKDVVKLMKLKPDESSPSELIHVIPYLSEHIEHLQNTGKIKYAANFETLRSSLIKYKGDDITFQELDVKFIEGWEYFLVKSGVSLNSAHTYLRNLRTLCNNLIKEKRISRDWYPFTNYSFRKFHKIETTKRAITHEDMQNFEAYNPKSYLEELAQNVFLFSFYCRGMSLKDIALLTDKNLVKDRLMYRRSKTGKQYSMKLIEPARAIIERYDKERMGNKYLLPLLDSRKHEDDKTIGLRINRMVRKLNKRIQLIAKTQGIEEHITTYVARHSFATILYRKGISVSVISEMLGHDSEATTRIYLKSFTTNELDDVVDQIL